MNAVPKGRLPLCQNCGTRGHIRKNCPWGWVTEKINGSADVVEEVKIAQMEEPCGNWCCGGRREAGEGVLEGLHNTRRSIAERQEKKKKKKIMETPMEKEVTRKKIKRTELKTRNMYT